MCWAWSIDPYSACDTLRRTIHAVRRARHILATQRLEQALRRQGYVEWRFWARWMPGRVRPQRQAALWSVTRKGRDLIQSVWDDI